MNSPFPRSPVSGLANWTDFERAEPKLPDGVSFFEMCERLARQIGKSAEQIAPLLRDSLAAETWMNSRYVVQIRRPVDKPSDQIGIIHLSIKRIDQQPVGPEHFRDFQRIKDELIGPDHEAVELYPMQSRLVDTANQYHLWCIDTPNTRWEFGFTEGMVTDLPDGPAKQQPFENQRDRSGKTIELKV
jgi:hypothetical protein